MPSSLFYHDTLIPESTADITLSDFPFWKGRRWPALFVCNGGNDDVEQDYGGWFNHREVSKALFYSKALLQSDIQAHDICIMSPFRAQVNLLRQVFRANGLHNVNIGPLEAFQGLESKVVILCTTRAREKFLTEDRERGLGVIFEKKRFNVAITRAKIGLFVIGNPHLLALDPTWKAFLQFCHRNGLWESEQDISPTLAATSARAYERDRVTISVNDWKPSAGSSSSPLGEGDVPTHLSSLERALVFAEKVERSSQDGRALRGGLDADEAMYAAGLAAEEVLREEDDGEI